MNKRCVGVFAGIMAVAAVVAFSQVVEKPQNEIIMSGEAYRWGTGRTDHTVTNVIGNLAGSSAVLVFDGGTWTFTNNVTFPATVGLVFTPGAVISVATNKTVTFTDNDLFAGTQAILSGRGTAAGTVNGAWGCWTNWDGMLGPYNLTCIGMALPKSYWATTNRFAGDVYGPAGNLQIKTNAVGAVEISADAVGASELAENSVDTTNIVNRTIKSEDIGYEQVAQTNIAKSAVTSYNIAYQTILATNIAPRAITQSQVATNTLGWTWLTTWQEVTNRTGALTPFYPGYVTNQFTTLPANARSALLNYRVAVTDAVGTYYTVYAKNPDNPGANFTVFSGIIPETGATDTSRNSGVIILPIANDQKLQWSIDATGGAPSGGSYDDFTVILYLVGYQY